MTSTPQYVKSKIILDKIIELEELRIEAVDSPNIRQMIDYQIWILKEILKPQ